MINLAFLSINFTCMACRLNLKHSLQLLIGFSRLRNEFWWLLGEGCFEGSGVWKSKPAYPYPYPCSSLCITLQMILGIGVALGVICHHRMWLNQCLLAVCMKCGECQIMTPLAATFFWLVGKGLCCNVQWWDESYKTQNNQEQYLQQAVSYMYSVFFWPMLICHL